MAQDPAAHLAAVAAKTAGKAHEVAKTATAHAMMAKMPMMTPAGAAGHAATGAMAAGAAGAALAASRNPGGLVSRVAKHPWLVFGLGLAAGYLIHKYRREIIGAATQATEMGKDFLLHQRESLEDLVAECKESEETETKAKARKPKAE